VIASIGRAPCGKGFAYADRLLARTPHRVIVVFLVVPVVWPDRAVVVPAAPSSLAFTQEPTQRYVLMAELIESILGSNASRTGRDKFDGGSCYWLCCEIGL
jgi:hypothetical protein